MEAPDRGPRPQHLTEAWVLLQHLPRLQPDTQPLWGSMSAQAMLEHLAEAVLLLTMPQVPILTPPDKLEKAHGYLMRRKKFPQGFVNPFVRGEAKLASLTEAAHHLVAALHQADAHLVAHPDQRPVHMIYGPLTPQEWNVFHALHFTHHFSQFGLVPVPEEFVPVAE